MQEDPEFGNQRRQLEDLKGRLEKAVACLQNPSLKRKRGH
eukprot:gene7076-172_t